MARVVEVAPRMVNGAVVVDVRTFKGDALGQALAGNQHSAYTGAHELADGLNDAFDSAVAFGISIATGIPHGRAKEILTKWYEDELDKEAAAKDEAEKAATQPAPEPQPAPTTPAEPAKVATVPPPADPPKDAA